MVLTSTPLEKRLEDVYSIVQLLDPHLLSPLRRFAAEHFMLSRHKKGNIPGYRRLDRLHAQLKTDLFAGIFDGGADTVEFTPEKSRIFS